MCWRSALYSTRLFVFLQLPVQISSYMRKLTIGLVVLCSLLVLMTIMTWRRVYLVSPSGDKTITFFQPFSIPFSTNYFYIIPGQYDGILAPDSGYVIVEPKGECVFHINWDSEEYRRIKMHLTSNLIADKLDTTKALYARTYNGYLDKYETYYYPKYCSYTFGEILDKKYQHKEAYPAPK